MLSNVTTIPSLCSWKYPILFPTPLSHYVLLYAGSGGTLVCLVMNLPTPLHVEELMLIPSLSIATCLGQLSPRGVFPTIGLSGMDCTKEGTLDPGLSFSFLP